ncbi:MAG: PAS domain S-box protein, partial [Myxococcota bacterium]
MSQQLLAVCPDLLGLLDAQGVLLEAHGGWEHSLGFPCAGLRGKALHEFIHPFDRDALHQALTGARSQEPRRAVLRAITHNGRIRHIQWALHGEPDGARVRVVGRDFTREFGEYRILRLQLGIMEAVAHSSSPEEVTGRALAALGRTLGYRVVICWHVSDDGKTLRSADRWTAAPEHERFFTASKELLLGTGDGLLGQTLRTREPSWVEDVQREPRFTRREIATDAGLRGWMAVPMVLDGRLGCVLELLQAEPATPDPALVDQLRVSAEELTRLTARMRADAQRDRFFNLSLDLLAICGRDGHFKRLSPAWVTTLGRSMEELLSVPFLSLVHPEDLPATLAAGERLQAGEDVVAFENRYRHKDGSYRWLSWRCHGLTPDDPVLYGVARDVTEQRRMEQALRRSEEHFRSLTENATDIMAILGLDGTLRYASPSVRRVLGRAPEDMVGCQVRNAVHPDDLAGAEEAFAPWCRPDEVGRVAVMRLRHLDGSWRWLECVGKGVPDDGELTVVVNCRDITERKDAEDALRRSEEQLRQAQKMEAVGRLAGGIAHDFNNMLTTILGGCELVLERPGLEPTAVEELRAIREAATRASTLTAQLLAFSRRQVVQRRPLSLNDVVVDMQQMLQRLIGSQVAVVTELAPELGAVMADAGQMQQVLMNLAVNARDAMPRGGTLTLRTSRVRYTGPAPSASLTIPPGTYVQLTVTDTGEGMTPETMAHLFEPFFTTKERGKGTGLGLATVYGIIHQCGGFIDAQSAPGAGTTFRIRLPLAADQAAPVVDARTPGATRARGETVLLVEDEPEVRALTHRILERAGYRVLAAARPEEALQLAERSQFHVLLTDAVMPGMGGVELARRLVERNGRLKVLVMSGHTEEALDPEVAFLAKPFTPQVLTERL